MNANFSPQPLGSRRVQAGQKRGLDREDSNTANKLRKRDVGMRPASCFRKRSSTERFRNFAMQAEFDTYDADGANSWRLQYMQKRTKIVEIVAAQGIIFALAQSGACAAFSRETCKRLCYLNTAPDEIIRSLFYNKNNDSLITVSVYSLDNYTSLRCRSTPLELIRRGKPEEGIELFSRECLKWPGFIEFDDVNCKVLTYSAVNHEYKVYDLKSYQPLHSLSDTNVQEVKISPGIMLVIHTSKETVPLKILNIEDGSVLKDFSHELREDRKIDFIEQFNEKLLVKQENTNLQVLDVRDGHRTEVAQTEFMTPTAFIFLYENQLFLTFRHRTVAVWNFKGELVTSFEDHELWYPDAQTNNIYITTSQDLILSYCKELDERERAAQLTPGAAVPPPAVDDRRPGSINVSSILTGKLIAKIQAAAVPRTSAEIRTAEALSDVTALYFDELRNEMYTGNHNGLLHLWSN